MLKKCRPNEISFFLVGYVMGSLELSFVNSGNMMTELILNLGGLVNEKVITT